MIGTHLQRLGVPSLRNPFWGRLVLTAAIAVVLLLCVAFKSSGASDGTKAITIFSHRGRPPVFPVSDAASNESRIAGIVNGNSWKQFAGDRRGAPGVFPKVLYVSVKDKGEVSPVAEASVAQCQHLNPEYQVEIMGDAERSSIVEQYAPSLLPVYLKLKPTERNDFWSYLVWSHHIAVHKPYLCLCAADNLTSCMIMLCTSLCITAA